MRAAIYAGKGPASCQVVRFAEIMCYLHSEGVLANIILRRTSLGLAVSEGPSR
jgi:hypothetical protein